MAEARRRVHETFGDRAPARGAVPRPARASRSVGEAPERGEWSRVAARRRTTARTAVLPARRGVPDIGRLAPSGRSILTRARPARCSRSAATSAARETSVFAVQARRRPRRHAGDPRPGARRARGRGREEPAAGRRGHARSAGSARSARPCSASRSTARSRTRCASSSSRERAAPRAAPGRAGVPRRRERTGASGRSPHPRLSQPAAAVGDEGRPRRRSGGALPPTELPRRPRRSRRCAARRSRPACTRCGSVRTS